MVAAISVALPSCFVPASVHPSGSVIGGGVILPCFCRRWSTGICEVCCSYALSVAASGKPKLLSSSANRPSGVRLRCFACAVRLDVVNVLVFFRRVLFVFDSNRALKKGSRPDESKSAKKRHWIESALRIHEQRPVANGSTVLIVENVSQNHASCSCNTVGTGVCPDHLSQVHVPRLSANSPRSHHRGEGVPAPPRAEPMSVMGTTSEAGWRSIRFKRSATSSTGMSM